MLEYTISFPPGLRGIALADLDAPLPAPPAPAGAGELQTQRDRQAEAEQQAVAQALAGLAEAARDLQSQQQRRFAEMEQAAVVLALAIASRLVHEKLQAGDFPVEAVVRQVVERLEPKGPVAVHLHPVDLALLQQRLGDQPLFADERTVRLVGDAALQRGSCRADAGDVSILAQLDAQLAELRHHLLRHAEGHVEPRPAHS